MDYAPSLDGCTVLAIFTIGGHDAPRYAILRMHPPLAQQSERRIKYRYSLEIVPPPYDGGDPILYVTSEINLDAYYGENDAGTHFLGVFDSTGRHRNLGASNAWGDLAAFAVKALSVACDELAIDRTQLQPAMSLETHSGMERVASEIFEASTSLWIRCKNSDDV